MRANLKELSRFSSSDAIRPIRIKSAVNQKGFLKFLMVITNCLNGNRRNVGAAGQANSGWPPPSLCKK